ncbi:MAG: hypothetical protein KIT84_28435 [Labilithrix sp.]|nr:hypothetical protein [Labilithrix sp.]MCW5814988.1 hypothetical protein [Labilithrix sp.]
MERRLEGFPRGAEWSDESATYLRRVEPARHAAFLAGDRARYVDELDVVRADGGRMRIEAQTYFAHDPATGHVVLSGAIKPLGDRRLAEERMEAIGRLAGGVAHELNNLLTVIVSYAQLARDAIPREHAAQEDLAQIAGAGRRAERRTRQLLAFGRRQRAPSAPLLLDEVVDTLAPLLRRVLGEGVDLRIERSDDLHAFRLDRARIEHVVMNLVVHARDAMPGGGRITIATQNAAVGAERAAELAVAPGTYVQLTVRGAGSGGDAPELASTYGIVKECGGAIDVESTARAGLTFGVYLPVHVRC